MDKNLLPWALALILGVTALVSTMKLLTKTSEGNYYRGQYEVLREIKSVYMPAPSSYEVPGE